MNDRTSSSDRRARLFALAGFAALAAILVSLGFWYYEVDKESVTRKEFQTLASIAELKSGQIQQWRKERSAEAQRAAADAEIRAAITNFLSASEDPEFEKDLRETLNAEVTGQDRSSALLFDSGSRLLASSDGSSDQANPATLKAIREALDTGRPAFSDFYRSPEGCIHVDLATPVRNGVGEFLAVLVLRHEADAFLYPLIQTWPAPSPSAETLLVQRDGDEMLFLNDLRHRKGAALTLRYPLSATEMPAAQAVLGRRGIFKGKDYRGIEVISSLLPVPGSPWFLVAKIDADEILAEVRFHSSVISLVVGLLLLLAAGLVTLLYRQQQNRMLKKLASSEGRNRSILRTAMDGFCVMDTEGRIQTVNEAYCRMTGYSEKELLTLRIGDLDASLSPAMVAEQISKVLSQGGDRFETRVQRKDGSFIALDVSTQFRPEEGLIVSFLHDITGRKAAHDKIARLSMLYEAHSKCSQAIVHSSTADELLPKICRDLVEHGGMKMAWVAMRGAAEGDRVSVAAAYGDGTGYLKDIEISLDAGSPLGCGPTGTAIREGKPVWCQDFLNDPATAPWHERGAAFGWISSAAIPLRGGGKTVGSLTIYSGRTDAFEEDVRGLLVEMAGNISFALNSFSHAAERRKMEQDLHDALHRAEAGNRAKSEFLAMMSHELRTPLNGVLGFTDLLAATSLDGEQQEFVQTIRDSGDHLLGVVNDILDFSSIEKRGLQLETAPFLISDLVESSGHAVLKAAADKGLEFRCEAAPGVPERVTGDQRRIRQILINLLGNAVKFTSRGSVVLRVAPGSGAGRPSLDFSVEDTGPGIPPETVELLFKPFTQADSTLSREFEGTGLGLAISQRLAEAMGGSISVSSTPGSGSTFTFHLPLGGDDAVAPKAPAGNPQSPAVTRPPAGGLVLVAEDDRVNSMLAEKMLKSLGLRVEFAANGREAVAAFVPGKYSAIFMDIQMPEMSGLEATEKIRKIEEGTGTRVPIIALTANVMPADHERCLAAGMDDFLSKPFKKDAMAAKLARCQLSAM